MSATIEAGLPVEIGRIDKELGRLWQDSSDTKTRASLINFAIYTENAQAVPVNTELISQIASEHACRALLIFADPSSPEPGAKAWINAHCHMVGKGDRQICSEQITFQLDGELVSAMPNVVFSHLDSDLPLYFWWQGEFRASLDERLWHWIDRLIFDSASWEKPGDQLAILADIDKLSGDRTVLCDLNWARILGTRYALAQLFDHSCGITRLKTIKRVSIATAHRTTGLLLLGWLAAQLDWKLQPLMGKDTFVTSDGRQVEFTVEEKPGADISSCIFECADATFEVTREDGSDFYNAHIHGGEVGEGALLIPAGKWKLVDILVIELSRGGKHPLYNKALATIQGLI